MNPERPVDVVHCATHGSFKVTGALPPAPCPYCLFYGKPRGGRINA